MENGISLLIVFKCKFERNLITRVLEDNSRIKEIDTDLLSVK